MNSHAWIAMAGMFVLTAVLLFVAAGDPFWADGWWFMGLFVVAGVAVVVWLARHDPGLLAARMNIARQEGQPFWDRLAIHAARFIWWGFLILMGLDGGRFHWLPLPDWVVWAGRVGILLGFWGIQRTFRENSFGAPVVRIQAERGHHVISTGPYAIVRHPMYASALIMLVSMGLALDSGWGALAAVGIELLLVLRIGGEERVLREGLPGYVEYTQRVRYRLIPLIW